MRFVKQINFTGGADMEKIVRQSLLYDFYGELLTEHQKNIYEDVVMNDMSYSEIARLTGVSRQGVYDLIKRCDKILEDYEDKLKLVDKFMNAKSKAKALQNTILEIKNTSDKKEFNRLIDKLEKDTESLLDEL